MWRHRASRVSVYRLCELFKFLCHDIGIERQVLIWAKDGREVTRNEPTETTMQAVSIKNFETSCWVYSQEVCISYCQRTALPVRSRARMSTRTLRANISVCIEVHRRQERGNVPLAQP